MKAILIDPFTLSVTEVDDDFLQLGVIQQYLAQGKRGPKSVYMDSCFRVASGYHSYVDDEGCFRQGQQWFRLRGAPYACAGRMIILRDEYTTEGVAEGSVEPWLLNAVKGIVEWIAPEEGEASIPPVTVRTMNPETGKLEVVSETPVDFSDKRPL